MKIQKYPDGRKNYLIALPFFSWKEYARTKGLKQKLPEMLFKEKLWDIFFEFPPPHPPYKMEAEQNLV